MIFRGLIRFVKLTVLGFRVRPARALATPLRLDVLTQVRLPSFFLQDFNLVRHPATGDVWWVPYSLPREPESDNGSRERDAVSSETADKVADVSSEAGQDAAVPPCGDMGHEAALADQSPSPALTVPESMQTTRRRGGTNGRRRPPGPTRYALLSLRALSLLRTQRGLAQRFAATGQASPRWDNVLSGGGKGRNRGAVVREDVGESVILALLRADVARELLGVAESQAAEEEQERFGKADECSDGAKRRKAREFMVRLGAWDEVNAKMRRGCVLWLGDGANTGAGPGAYATIDLPHRSYFSKLPVYNIPKLLGDEQLERLRKGSAVFRDNILVGLHNLYTLRLQQKLWRLQGLVSEG